MASGRDAAIATLCFALSSCAGAAAESTSTPPTAEHPGHAAPAEDEPSVAAADEPDEEPPREVSDAVRRLADAFAERLTVSRRRDGTRVLTRRCREGPVDCEARLTEFARLIHEAAERHDLDPLLLAAMALRESGLDPAALGRNREAGIVQLHPRGAGRGVRYVQDDAYRARCQQRIGACQGEVLEVGARTLEEGIARCGGLRAGLGAYASGHCTSRARYIDRVLEERETLRGLTR